MSADNKPVDDPELPRDVLAAIAMHALTSNPSDELTVEEMADFAYRQADAMLAAREKSCDAAIAKARGQS